MSDAFPSAAVVAGLITENAPRMLAQAIRLVRSIRWFGAEFANVRVVVCGVGPLERHAHITLESLGAEIRTVSRFHPANPTANRHQLLAELLDAPEPLLVLLDCDTLVVQDPLPYLSGKVFQAKIAPTATVSDDVFNRLFAHFGLPKPPRNHVTPFSGMATIPYFNAGVLAIPTTIARTLAPSWARYNRLLADNPTLAAPCQRHIHQASLSLALAETGVPYAELPAALNYQINATHVAAPDGYAETDPVIIHYHHLATEDGFLLPTPYPGAQARIEMFHDRLRASGFVPGHAPVDSSESRPILVLGMHRSGTSLVTELLTALGSYAGNADELAPPDMYNPMGYWEHTGAAKLNRDVLKTLDASWTNVTNADIERLSPEQRADSVARARAIAESLRGRPSFVLKDPRTSLLFGLWCEALGDPVCVIVWREPAAVARSLANRDQIPLLLSLALWEHYNRKLLRDTEASPRILVSYEKLLASPIDVAREIRAALTELGVAGLRDPDETRLQQIVNVDFNRSGRRAEGVDALLDSGQRALLEGLRDQSVLHAPAHPPSARTTELLAEFGQLEHELKRLRGQVEAKRRDLDERDLLLRGVFESRSWRLGHTLTAILRGLRRGETVTALDRWREMKKDPDA